MPRFTPAVAFVLVPFGLSLAACSGTVPATPEETQANTSALGACWDEVTLPRPALAPTPSPSVQIAYDAWRVAFDAYQGQASIYSAESAAHAATYNAAAGSIPGQPCTTDAQCATNDEAFPGHCRVYYDVGQCEVRDLHPLPVGPVAPPQPQLTCADFTCANADYECELEENTGGVACVLQRCKTDADPRRGGDGNRSGGGGRRGRDR